MTAEGKRVGALLSDHRGGGAAGALVRGRLQPFRSDHVVLRQHGQCRKPGVEAAAPLSLPPPVAGFRRRRPLARRTDRGGRADADRRSRDGSQVDQHRRHRSIECARHRRRLSGRRIAGARAARHRRLEASSRPATFRARTAISAAPSSTCRRRRAARWHSGDVLVFFAPGGGGFGDPLDREPERVADDVANGWVSRERAREKYGVALDGRRTASTLRQRRRCAKRSAARRKQRPTAPWTSEDRLPPSGGRPEPGGSARTSNLRPTAHSALPPLRRDSERPAGTGRGSRNGRSRAAGPWMALRHGGDGPNFVLEEISCPSCATLMSVREVRRSEQPTRYWSSNVTSKDREGRA